MFLSLDNGDFVSDRFIVTISEVDTPSERGLFTWRRVTYLRGTALRTGYCLSSDAEEFIAAGAAGNADL